MATQCRLLVCFCILTYLYSVSCCRNNKGIRHHLSRMTSFRHQCQSSKIGVNSYQNDQRMSELDTSDATHPDRRTRDTAQPASKSNLQSYILPRNEDNVKIEKPLYHDKKSNVSPFQTVANLLYSVIDRIVFPLLHLGAWFIIFWVFRLPRDTGLQSGSEESVLTKSSDRLLLCDNEMHSNTGTVRTVPHLDTDGMKGTKNLNNNANSYDFNTDDSKSLETARSLTDDVSRYVNGCQTSKEQIEVKIPENNEIHIGKTQGDFPETKKIVSDSSMEQAIPHSIPGKRCIEMVSEAVGICCDKGFVDSVENPHTVEKSFMDGCEISKPEIVNKPGKSQVGVELLENDAYSVPSINVSNCPSVINLDPDDTVLSELDTTAAINTDPEYVCIPKDNISFRPTIEYTSDAVTNGNLQVLHEESLQQRNEHNNFLESTGKVHIADGGQGSMEQFHTLCQRLLETSSFLEPESTDERFSLFNNSLNIADGDNVSKLELTQELDDDMAQAHLAQEPTNLSYDKSVMSRCNIKNNYAGIADETEQLPDGYGSTQTLNERCCSQNTNHDELRPFYFSGFCVRNPKCIIPDINNQDHLCHQCDAGLCTDSNSDKTTMVQCLQHAAPPQTSFDCVHSRNRHLALSEAQQIEKVWRAENLSDPEGILEKVPLLYQLIIASVESVQREFVSEMIKCQGVKIPCPESTESCPELVETDNLSSPKSVSNGESSDPDEKEGVVHNALSEIDRQSVSSRAALKESTKTPEIPMDLDFVYMSSDTGKLVPVKDFIKILETCFLPVEDKKEIVYKQYIIAREKCCLDWIEAIRNRGKKILPKWWLHRNLRVEGLESNKCRKRREWLERKQAQALEEHMLREKKDLIFLGTKPDISDYLDSPDGPDSMLFSYSEDGCPMFEVEQYFDAVSQSGVKDSLTHLEHLELVEGLPSRWKETPLQAHQDFPSELHEKMVNTLPRAENTTEEPRTKREFRRERCSKFQFTLKRDMKTDGRGDSFYESS